MMGAGNPSLFEGYAPATEVRIAISPPVFEVGTFFITYSDKYDLICPNSGASQSGQKQSRLSDSEIGT